MLHNLLRKTLQSAIGEVDQLYVDEGFRGDIINTVHYLLREQPIPTE